jgi:hypothetical protein
MSDEYLTNRQKKLEAKGDQSYYCGGCDANSIQDGGKCDVCGYRSKKRRNKVKRQTNRGR